MSATEVIDQIKSLRAEERWTVFRFLSKEFAHVSDGEFFDEFTMIGSEGEQSDVKFAEFAQAEVVRHGQQFSF